MIAQAHRVGISPGTSTMYVPYATPSDYKGASLSGNNSLGDHLGIIFDRDFNLTGRSWPALGDVPGSATITDTQRTQKLFMTGFVVLAAGIILGVGMQRLAVR